MCSHFQLIIISVNLNNYIFLNPVKRAQIVTVVILMLQYIIMKYYPQTVVGRREYVKNNWKKKGHDIGLD